MRTKTVILVVALGAALSATTPASARNECTLYIGGRCAQGDGPTGRKCGFNSTTDVTREAGWQTGDINADPLVTAGAGTLYCSIHVNSNSHYYGGEVTESVRATDDAVAVMPPRTLNYTATWADDIVLCTTWVPDSGAPLYWVSDNPGFGNTFSTGYWDTDVNSICGVMGVPSENEWECRYWLAVDQRAGTNIAEIWQDCEGYEPII